MQRVLVIDQERRPLMPCTPARARWLLTRKRAAVFRSYPFTIRLGSVKPEAVIAPLRMKIDPGSRTTGMAVVNETTGEVVSAGEVTHRGQQIKGNLEQRRTCRRARRQRRTRYRQPRFDNRMRPKGWLAPSLRSRVDNIVTWVARIRRWCPIRSLSLELVRFDTQALVNPAIEGIEFQQGTLQGYELREYLLEKWGRRCAYCQKTGVPLQVEHIVPKARGGSNRVANLALACEPCNQLKGSRTAEEFGYPQVQAQALKPLKDAAAVNTTRWALYERLKETGLPVETGTGGRTKWNRSTRGIPKAHWLDAANVGASTPLRLRWRAVTPLLITAQGWQRRQMCLMDRFGFPRTEAKETSRAFVFKTGDMVRAVVPTGKPQGTHVGKVAIKAKGQFTITTNQRAVPDVSYRYCQLVQRSDGYQYRKGAGPSLPIL